RRAPAEIVPGTHCRLVESPLFSGVLSPGYCETSPMLAEYAVRAEDSRGRRYPEPKHPYRNDFERDRDRVVHARAFRRLKDKTQVFPRRYSDHFRNRLTHTIEV